MISLSETHAGIWDLYFKFWNPKIPEILSECGHGIFFSQNNWEKGKKTEKWSTCSNRCLKKSLETKCQEKQLRSFSLHLIKATKMKEAAAPQRAREGWKWYCLVHSHALDFMPRYPRHLTRESASGSRALLLPKHEHGQQGEAFLEWRVQNLFCLLLWHFWKPLRKPLWWIGE